MEMTRLLPQFETYDSVEEAITAARPRVLCIYESTDVCTFLREILCNAGFNALTTVSFDDARILCKAMKPKLVLVSAKMQSQYGKPVEKTLHEIDPEASIMILDENFGTRDPGEAAEELLNKIGSPEQKPS